RVRLSDPLQTSRQVRRLAHHPALLRLAGTNEIADHDQARRDPNTRPERLLDTQLADRLDDRQSRPDGTLGIILMGVRIAEIDEHPIAHVPGHEAVEPGDRLRAALIIGADYRTQILWVERGRERGRANEAGQHNRQLATLGLVSARW